MRRLPIAALPLTPLSMREGLARDGNCTRCGLLGDPLLTATVCMQPEIVRTTSDPADPGSGLLYVVSEYPSRQDDAAHRPHTGQMGATVRRAIEQHWKGQVVYDHALRCSAHHIDRKKISEKHVNACNPYLAHVVRNAHPARIITLGKWAAFAVLGRSVQASEARRGYAWWAEEQAWEDNPTASSTISVHMLPSLSSVIQNRFLMRQWNQDLEFALRAEVGKDLIPYLGDAEALEVETREDALELLQACESHDFVAVDIESSGEQFTDGYRVESIAFTPCDYAHDFSLSTPLSYVVDRARIEVPDVLAWVKHILRNPDIKKVGHNIKFDALGISSDPLFGVLIDGIEDDTRVTRKLLEPGVVGTLAVAAELVGQGGHKEEAQTLTERIERDLTALANEHKRKPLKSGKPRKPYAPKYVDRARVRECDLDLIRSGYRPAAVSQHYLAPIIRKRYNARDTLVTAALHTHLERQMEAKENLRLVRDEITRPALAALTQIESWGVEVNRAGVHMFIQHLEGRLAEVLIHINAVAPNLNPDSAPQLRELLYNRLRLPVLDTTDSGEPSTDADTLGLLAEKHPIVKHILDYRHFAKMHGTYAEGLLSKIRSNNRVHPEYLLDGAETGRVSCRNPNLQNIPRAKGSDEGKMARNNFIARPGYVLVEADMGQQELRVAAFITGDQAMIDRFNSGADFHRATLERIHLLAFKIPHDEWARMLAAEHSDKAVADKLDELRSQTKSVATFGVWYGKSAMSLAEEMGCSVDEAQAVLDAILGDFPTARDWRQSMVRFAEMNGGVYTYWNGKRARWRPLPDAGLLGDSREAKAIRRSAGRAAINTPIQGTGADFVTASLYPVVKRTVEDGYDDARVVLTVHDSIVGEVRREEALDYARMMRQVMTSHYSGAVKLVADFKVGNAWGSMVGFDPTTATALPNF